MGMSGLRDPRYQAAAAEAAAEKRPWRRRRFQIAAVVGGVLVLASGGLMARQALHGDGKALSGTARRPWQAESPAPAGGLGRGGRVQPATPGGPGATAGGNARAIPKASTAAPAGPADSPTTTTIDIDGITATVTTSGSMPQLHHTLRVVSARANLTGRRELAWAADTGHAVGDARCTQNFRFNPYSSARLRPTLLLCWRASAGKTVYTVAVDVDHRPSERASVAVIDRAWKSLG
jgi:hypothetical protein